MTRLSLSFACGDYEIMRPLADGTVRPDGIDLNVLVKDRARILQSARRDECDLSEFNVVGYLADSEHDDDLFALPVFPHRRFRLGFIFVNANAGIREPQDLIGRTLAVRGERPAAVVWLRGILNEHLGVPYDAVNFVDPFGLLGPRPEGFGESRPTRDQIDAMLLDGRLDAVLSAGIPPAFLAGDPRIGRLFPDFEQHDLDYYRKTGIFPIMHVVTIRRSLVERAPWVPVNLLRAFEDAKAAAYQRARNPRTMPLAFFQRAWEQQSSILGADPWAYGTTESNRRNLATIMRYAHEQGLIEKERRLVEVVADLDTARLERFEGI